MSDTKARKKPALSVARLPSEPCRALESCSAAASKLLFELSPMELVELIANVLQEVVDANDRLLGGKKQTSSSITRFHNREPPGISLEGYLKRLLHLAPFSLDTLLVAVTYLHRLTQLQARQSEPRIAYRPVFAARSDTAEAAACRPSSAAGSSATRYFPPITPWTAHRLVLAALAIAGKYTSDAYIGQARLAKVAGIAKTELFELEIDFFDCLEYKCYVSSETLDWVCRQIIARDDRFGRQSRLNLEGEKVHNDEKAAHPVKLFSKLSLDAHNPEESSISHAATPPSDGSSESSYFSSSTDSRDSDETADRMDMTKLQMPALIPIT